MEDVTCLVGCGEGSVINYTDQCFTAIESLHDLFVHCLTPAEKEIKRDGWMKTLDSEESGRMYDGTIVVLFQKPGLNGDAYYTWKGNCSGIK